MTGPAWVFLTALAITSLLLAIAVGGNANLAAQLRDLRRENSRLRADRTSGGVR